MGSDSKYYQEVLSKLERFVRKEYVHIILSGIQLMFIAVVANFTFFTFIELIANLDSAFRTFLFFLFLLLTISAFSYLVLLPLFRYFRLFRKETYFDIANRAGSFFPSLKDNLLNAMQLITERASGNYYSMNLVDAAFKNVYHRSKGIKFESAVKFDKARKILPYFIGLMIFSALLLLFVPGMLSASNRLVNFDKEFIPPPRFIFEVNPGNAEITRGDDILITASVIGEPPKEVFFALKNEDEADYKYQKIYADSTGKYNLHLSSIRNSFKYFVSSEDIKSQFFEIKVINRPLVNNLELSIIPPSYSEIPKSVQKDNGNVTSLVGSRVEINLSSTKNLTNAFLEFNDSSIVELNVTENNASGLFTVRKDNSYIIKLIDESENSNSSPITYNIKALYDAYPVIELLSPNKNLPLANDNRLTLLAKVADDYGFSKLNLNYRLSASRYEPPQTEFSSIEIPLEDLKKEIDINYIWNLTHLHLAVDDVVTYYLEVFDNDFISGPKSTKTSSFTIRVPSLDEILADADEVHSQTELALEETLKEAEELKNKLEEIDQELKKDEQELTWEEKENISDALEKFKELQEKVDKVNDELSEMRQNLQENNLLSEETMEKYLELQDLMDQLTSEEMKKAMEQMQQLLQKMNRDLTQNAMENLKFDEERFKKSIERTLNLLKRIQVEQKVDELIKRTEELSKEQESLKEQTEQSDLSDKNKQDELSNSQENISNELQRMEEEMQKLKEKMSELEDMPMEEMEKMMEEFNKQQNEKLSEEASDNIQQQQQEMAMQNQQQLQSNMNQMNEMMMQMQSEMNQKNQIQTFTDMMKILDNLISLSKEQEELKDESQNLDPNSSSLNQLAQEQIKLSENLKNILQQMADLSQKTFAISPEMGEALGKANQKMQMSLQSMQNRNGSFSAIQQGEAMRHLNEAASMMKSSMEGMMQSGGQGGMMSLMQQLQQMSGQQMNLNNMTQMLKQMQQGNLSPQQQGQFQRLGQQQELIRKSMEQLNQEAKLSGLSKKLPSDLDNILEKMQEVITDMNTQKLDDELIQKQENILSKMLDAQRSINERDFEKKRESRTGEIVLRDSPYELNLSPEEAMNKIQDELNRAVREGYTKDYEELIIKYYESLQENDSGN